MVCIVQSIDRQAAATCVTVANGARPGTPTERAVSKTEHMHRTRVGHHIAIAVVKRCAHSQACASCVQGHSFAKAIARFQRHIHIFATGVARTHGAHQAGLRIARASKLE